MIRILTTGLALVLLLPAATQAQDRAWAVEIGAATDNRSKAASKSLGEPAAWIEGEWDLPSDVRLIGGAETVRSSTGADAELSLGVGWNREFAGVELDLTAEHKRQVGALPGTDHDAWEFTADLERRFGRGRARVRLQHSPDGTGSTRSWTWAEAEAGYPLTERLEAIVSVGRREQVASVDYTGWSAGLVWEPSEGLEVDLRYIATDVVGGGEQYDDQLVLAVSRSF